MRQEGPRLSVVICTYNRAELLRQALESLASQRVDRSVFEVLVVDNNSSDCTAEVAAAYAERCGNVRHVVEQRQGLAHARNRGLREAGADYVGYIDDDCKVPAQWLEVAAKIAKTISPVVFGGPFYAFYDSPKPAWYKDSYGSYELGSRARNLKDGEFFYGGHIFFRRRVLEELGGFDSGLGMTGNRLGYGEEIVPQRLLRARMPNEIFYYDPELFVYHLVRMEKMSLRWIAWDTFVRAGYTYRVFQPDAPVRRRIGVLKEAAGVAVVLGLDCLRGLVARGRKKYPYVQHYLGEHTMGYVRWLGTLREQYRRAAEMSSGREEAS